MSELFLCEHCYRQLEQLTKGSFVHKLSRSTRCCNEAVWRDETKPSTLPVASTVREETVVQTIEEEICSIIRGMTARNRWMIEKIKQWRKDR